MARANIIIFQQILGNDGFLASYEISKIIVKAGKPHNIGETVILPAVSAIISSVMRQNAIEITNSIPLSNSSASRRIDEMAEDVEKQLIAHLQVKQFALQLDESDRKSTRLNSSHITRYRMPSSA